MDRERWKEVFRKQWIRLVRLQDEQGCTIVAKHHLNNPRADLQDYYRATGVRLIEHLGCYVELCGEVSPIAPVLPGIIKPILIMKREDGKIKMLHWELSGLYHATKQMAWIKTDLWEQLLGDENYLENHIFQVFLGVKKNEEKEERKAKQSGGAPETK